MTIAPKFEPALKWFTGKALENAKAALVMLTQSEANGAWYPKHSRTVTAALSKQNVAEKFARKNERDTNGMSMGEIDKLPKEGLLGDVCEDRERSWEGPSGRDVLFAMRFGEFKRAQAIHALCQTLEPWCKTDSEREALATVKEWAKDMFEVGATAVRLDATRPKPVYFMKTLSKTVLTNVGSAMGIALETVQMPEIVYVKRLGMNPKTGEHFFYWEPEVKWPEGTEHHTSKLGTAFSHCEACGHAIKNPFNWVPILAYRDGVPVSVWTGKDCAENLFGCDVKNGVDFTKAVAPKAG